MITIGQFVYDNWDALCAEAQRRGISLDALTMLVQPPPILPPPTRFRVRYGIVYCAVCGLAVPYCPGHAPADVPAKDGAESDLSKRIAQARAQAGGR